MHSHYKKLVGMIILSFVAMYFLMFAMVNVWNNVFIGINQFYMAGLMTFAMVLIEIIIMGSMYGNKKINSVIFLVSLIALVGFWSAIRNQTAIGDKEFLKSMIPHHGGAILMCSEAKLSDPDIIKLCQNIIKGQQSEIDFMKQKLNQIK